MFPKLSRIEFFVCWKLRKSVQLPLAYLKTTNKSIMNERKGKVLVISWLVERLLAFRGLYSVFGQGQFRRCLVGNQSSSQTTRLQGKKDAVSRELERAIDRLECSCPCTVELPLGLPNVRGSLRQSYATLYDTAGFLLSPYNTCAPNTYWLDTANKQRLESS